LRSVAGGNDIAIVLLIGPDDYSAAIKDHYEKQAVNVN